MATLAHPEPLNLYSGWGNHISPSNSKWIHENLKDMDVKVKQMFKLIEGDADSFARKADMYYKRRPELKKLVEDFARGYRALAERYEHSTRMLRHAHRTMAEAFPNQMPFLLSDESPYSLSPREVEPHHSKMLSPAHSQFDSDDLRKEAFGSFSDFFVKKRIGPDFEESDFLYGRKGMKQYNQMLAAGERVAHSNSSEGKVREVLNFLEDEVKVREKKTNNQDQEDKVRHDTNIVINNLQQDISQLSSEIHVLKDQIMEESKRANNAENEVKSLKGTISELNTEKDVSFERISSMELLLSRTENELKRLNVDMEEEIKKLKNVEELNQSLQLDLETLQKKQKMQENEINQKQEELEKFQVTLQEKYQKCLEAEMALEASENKYKESIEEVKCLGLKIQKGIENLSNSELCNAGLQEEICNLKKENSSLNEQRVQDALTIKGLQEEIMLLEEKKKKLEDEVLGLLQEKEALRKEVDCMKEDKSDLEKRHQALVEKLQALSTCVESLQAAINELQNGNDELKEVCRKYEAEKVLLTEKLKDMDKISEKNAILDKLLLDANFELTVLREKVSTLETTHESLKSEISIYLSERESLASQVKVLSENVEVLLGKNAILESSLSDANREVASLRSKLKDFEDSYQILSDKNSILLTDNNTLISQVDSVTKNLVSWESRYAEVMNKHLKLLIERDLMINEVKELEDAMKIEKQQHETLLETYKHLLGTSEKLVTVLQDNNKSKENEIKKLVVSLSDLEDNNQQMHLEISILATLFKHIGIDVSNLGSQKYSLERALEVEKGAIVALASEKHELLERIKILVRDVETNNQREELLKMEIKVLSSQLIDLQMAIQATQTEIAKLIEEKHSLSLDFCDLRKQHNILEEEHVEVLVEALNLDLLYVLFHSLHAERGTELKSLNNNLESLHVIKNELTDKINKLNEKMSLLEMEKSYFSDSVSFLEEELKNRLLSLEFDLNIATSLYEELNLQTETTRSILKEKEIQILEANQKVRSSEDENMQLKELLKAFQLDNAEIKLVKEEMEKKALALSELVTSRNEEIRCLNEENKLMQRDIEEMHRNIELLACREGQLVSQLQKEMNEIQHCEGEITAMMTEIQILTVSAEVRDEKFHELIVEKEGNSIVQKELLLFELCFAKEYMEELQNKLNDLEGENKWLKADLDAYLLMLESLWDGVSLMEEQILSISQLKFLSNQVKEDFLTSHQHNGSNHSTETERDVKATGVPLLEKLNDKVKSLQLVVGDTITLLEQEMAESSANLDVARKEVELLKTKALAVPDKKDSERPKGEYNETIKDIQLDVASSSLHSWEFLSRGQNINNSEIDELSANAENEVVTVGKDEEYSSSFKLITKELLNTNELSLSKRSLESQPEWKKTIEGRLDSDCQRLLDLKAIMQDLKGRTNSLKEKIPSSYGYDPIKEQIKEAEAALLELTDTNSRLKIMMRNCASSNRDISKPEDSSSVEARQISNQAKLASEKVGRLEVKLHKIQYVLMKLEEKYKIKQQRTRVALRDYLYGRRDDHKQVKANPFCGFMRPKIKGGN